MFQATSRPFILTIAADDGETNLTYDDDNNR
jgi:hypothetical protein